jgi:hypothetical protein
LLHFHFLFIDFCDLYSLQIMSVVPFPSPDDRKSAWQSPGQAAAAQNDPAVGQLIFYPPSKEELFWAKCLPDLTNKPKDERTPGETIFYRIFVTPLTNLTGFSLMYQAYLNEIFHTKLMTKISHLSFMPFVNFFICMFFAQFHYTEEPYKVGVAADGSVVVERRLDAFVKNGAMIYVLSLWIWYTIWGFIGKARAMGLFMAFPLLMIYGLGTMYYEVCRDPETDNPWYNPTASLYTNPIIWCFVCSFFQALGHAFEPALPPRVSGSTHWLDYRAVYNNEGCIKFFVIMIGQTIFGTIDEFMASPRLLPILFLRLLYGIGYNPAQWELINRLSQLSLASGNPALDYIGTGGDTVLGTALKKDAELIKKGAAPTSNITARQIREER